MGVGRAFLAGLGGLNAYSQAVGYISDNLANVGTIGFKRVDADFQSFVTRSTSRYHDPGGVSAQPAYRTSVGGQVVNSDNATSFAVTDGLGFIPVKVPQGATGGVANFNSSLQRYTRAGDFQMDANGYMVNASGWYLMGIQEQTAYTGNIAATPSAGNLVGVRVDPLVYKSVPGSASTTVDFNANFPANAAVGSAQTSEVQFYDSLGNARTLQVTYTRNVAANTWDVTAALPGFTTAPTITITNTGGAAALNGGGASQLVFTTGGALQSPTDGQIGFSIDWTGPPVPVPAVNTPPVDGLTSPQAVVVDFGQAATVAVPATGSTQYAGTGVEVRSVVDQTGRAPGNFQKASIDQDGYVIFAYSNGQQLKPYRVPLSVFSNADKMERATGAVFGDSVNAGVGVLKWAGSGDTGRIIPSAFEQSNVDIGEELTKMIVAQRAYSSNGKVISTADEMIQEVLNLKR